MVEFQAKLETTNGVLNYFTENVGTGTVFEISNERQKANITIILAWISAVAGWIYLVNMIISGMLSPTLGLAICMQNLACMFLVPYSLKYTQNITLSVALLLGLFFGYNFCSVFAEPS